jgi:hypothetical protein
MKHITLLISLCALLCGPLAAQSSPPPVQSRPPSMVSAPSALEAVPSTALQDKQKQLRDLERQLSVMRQQIATQQTPTYTRQAILPNQPVNVAAGLPMRQYRGLSGRLQNLLVVPDPNTDPTQIASLLEDMQVMSRILEKELKEIDRSKRTNFPWGQGQGQIRGFYLDGYGLVLQFQVGFPLMANGPDKPQETGQDTADKVWHETRREIFQPGRSKDKDEKETEYDVKKVSDLKEMITRTLQHATNIKDLQTTESVVIIVTTTGGREDNPMMYDMMYGMDDYGGYGMGGGMMGGMRGGMGRKTSVLTVKAAKSAIDDVAQKKTTLDEFRSKLQTTLY